MGKTGKLLAYIKMLNTRGFWAGFSVGFFYFFWIFWWFWAIYPLEMFGLENKAIAFIIVLPIFLASVLISCFWWGLFGFFSQKLYRSHTSSFLLAPAIAGTFVVTEYARAIFFSIFWFGSGGDIGPFWTLGNLAYLFVDIAPIALSASWWGIYGIEFLIICIISSLLLFILDKSQRKNHAVQILILVPVFMIPWISSGYFSKKEESSAKIPVAIVQTDNPAAGVRTSEESLEDFRRKLQFLEQAKEIKEGLIIFPEGTDFFSTLSRLLKGPDMEKYFKSLSPKELFIVNSIRAEEGDNYRSRALVISSQAGLTGIYDKQMLTPGGEFLPYIVRLPLTLISPVLGKRFEAYREFSAGYGSNIITYKDLSIKIIICSELISPAKASRGNADINIILASFAIWSGDSHVINQNIAMMRFRAIETGKYTVLAANAGRSLIINELGNISKITSSRGYELLTGDIIPNKNRTWYNYIGDWPILLLSSAFFAVGLKKIRDDKTS